MYAVSKVKLTAWMRRPRSSFGLLAGIASFVVLMSLAAWLEQAYDWMLSAPFTLAASLLVSMATGIIVQHRFTVRLGDALINSRPANSGTHGRGDSARRSPDDEWRNR